MEDKIKIEFKVENPKEVEFCGTVVKIREMSVEDYEYILADIINTVMANEELENKMFYIELRAIRDIAELCTNIDVSDIEINRFISGGQIYSLLCENMVTDIKGIINNIKKEYELYHLKDCFGIIAKKVPNAKQMEKSVNNMVEAINTMDKDRLELLAKSIVWDKAPALGQMIAPAQHVKQEG